MKIAFSGMGQAEDALISLNFIWQWACEDLYLVILLNVTVVLCTCCIKVWDEQRKSHHSHCHQNKYFLSSSPISVMVLVCQFVVFFCWIPQKLPSSLLLGHICCVWEKLKVIPQCIMDIVLQRLFMYMYMYIIYEFPP